MSKVTSPDPAETARVEGNIKRSWAEVDARDARRRTASTILLVIVFAVALTMSVLTAGQPR
jgi:hypothetical protein